MRATLTQWKVGKTDDSDWGVRVCTLVTELPSPGDTFCMWPYSLMGLIRTLILRRRH